MSTIDDAWLDAHRLDPTALRADPYVGLEHVERELRPLVARLAAPERAALLRAQVPAAALFVGEPGSGKTASCRRLLGLLGEDCPAYETGSADLDETLVADLFRALRARHTSCVLVIDELDLVAISRDRGPDPASRRVLTALLRALDGLEAKGGVFLAAASSRPTHELDPALLRRVQVIALDLPDADERAAIFRAYLAGRPVADDLDCAALAAATEGWTPSEIREACNDAAGLALVAERDLVTRDDLDRAIDRDGRIGPEPEPVRRVIDETRLERVTIHEAGHVVTCALVGLRLQEVVVFDHSGATTFAEALTGRGAGVCRNAITASLAGTAAEVALLGEASPAAASDIASATHLAADLVRAGLAPGSPGVDPGHALIERTPVADAAAAALVALVAECRGRAERLVAAHTDAIRLVAAALATAVRDREPDSTDGTVELALVGTALTAAGIAVPPGDPEGSGTENDEPADEETSVDGSEEAA